LVSELFNGKLFGEGDSTLAEQFNTYPPVNISESEHAFHIAILAPGRKK
jgi:HSP20 family molecular chaperone IbpA